MSLKDVSVLFGLKLTFWNGRATGKSRRGSLPVTKNSYLLVMDTLRNLINRVTDSWWCNRHNHGQTIHPTENNFKEFVANVLRDNMGMIIFDLWGFGGC